MLAAVLQGAAGEEPAAAKTSISLRQASSAIHDRALHVHAYWLILRRHQHCVSVWEGKHWQDCMPSCCVLSISQCSIFHVKLIKPFHQEHRLPSASQAYKALSPILECPPEQQQVVPTVMQAPNPLSPDRLAQVPSPARASTGVCPLGQDPAQCMDSVNTFLAVKMQALHLQGLLQQAVFYWQ